MLDREREIGDAGDPEDADGTVTILASAIAELAIIVGSPAGDASIFDAQARVSEAEGEVAWALDLGVRDRRRLRRRGRRAAPSHPERPTRTRRPQKAASAGRMADAAARHFELAHRSGRHRFTTTTSPCRPENSSDFA